MNAHVVSVATKNEGAVIASEVVRFSMRDVPLLSQGASFDSLATAENLWLAIKVYSKGGENALHQHRGEDHAFVVLQGRAIFHFGDGSSWEAKAFEGVMLPKGSMYRFEAGEEENLVLLRVGGAQRPGKGIGEILPVGIPKDIQGSYDADGSRKDPNAAKTGTPSEPIITIPGKFFASSV